jgi:hypothetical protein
MPAAHQKQQTEPVNEIQNPRPMSRRLQDIKAHIQTLAAREAQRAGYAPCIRCMKQYLTA